MESLNKKSPVILYKRQGAIQPNEYNDLCVEDFVLGIQTLLQAEIMKKFGGKVICVDATHGTNGYDLILITVMLIDEYGEGFPVAWCISNREDQLLLINFFNALRMRVGVIEPAWYLAEQYYTAWVSSFSYKPHKIVCTWHIDRAWREHLKELKDLELQASVYHNLRVLIEETNKDKFEALLGRTRKELLASGKTRSFGKYFEKYYAKIKEHWAMCYRVDCTLNTNMYVEAFHRVLKYVYMKGKVNKRLTKCIFVLMKPVRDKGFERLVKLEKGKNTERIRQIKT